jgi:hypothetical protein
MFDGLDGIERLTIEQQPQPQQLHQSPAQEDY